MQMLEAAWDRGIDNRDMANVFSSSDSQRIIGKVLLEKYPILQRKLLCIVGEECDNDTAYAQPLRGSRGCVKC